MSLSTVIIFERHWDTTPKSLIKDMLPDLSKQGYATLCFEAPQNLSSAEIIDRHHAGLECDTDIQQQAKAYLKRVGITQKLSDISFRKLADLLRLYVSSKRYLEVAEKLKQLPASYLLKEVFKKAAELSIEIKGIDINYKDYDAMTSLDISERMSSIRFNEDHRITTLFNNLLKLRAQQEEGIVFICGALHAKGLIDKFKKHGLQDQVLYYFPHSSSRYEEDIDDINEVAMNDTLANNTYLLSEKDISHFKQKIINEVTAKTKYTKEIQDYNSHTQFLSDCFKTNFRAFLRPGYHVDALVDADSSNIKNIHHCVTAAGVKTHHISFNDKNYLVIPNVNTRDIADRIRKIR